MKIILSFSLILIAGCASQPTQQTAPKPFAAPVTPYQRFVPVTRSSENTVGVPWSGAFALDTMTGKLCQTYLVQNKEFEDLPLCSQLWKDPTVTTYDDWFKKHAGLPTP